MTLDEVKERLEAGDTLYYGAWTWSKYCYSCGDGDDEYGPCCYESFESADEAFEHLEMMCDNWEDVL